MRWSAWNNRTGNGWERGSRPFLLPPNASRLGAGIGAILAPEHPPCGRDRLLRDSNTCWPWSQKRAPDQVSHKAGDHWGSCTSNDGKTANVRMAVGTRFPIEACKMGPWPSGKTQPGILGDWNRYTASRPRARNPLRVVTLFMRLVNGRYGFASCGRRDGGWPRPICSASAVTRPKQASNSHGEFAHHPFSRGGAAEIVLNRKARIWRCGHCQSRNRNHWDA